MTTQIEKLCAEKNIRLTENGKIIAKVISESKDHPNVEEVFNRVSKIMPNIGIATVYRTIGIFEQGGIITKHDFGDGKARYEEHSECEHHDHLIDVKNGKIVEFFNEEIEKMKEKIAFDLGYKLIGHKLELYAVPLK